MRKPKLTPLATIIIVCSVIAGVVAVSYLTLTPATWTVNIDPSVSAKLFFPEWIDDVGANYVSIPQNENWYQGKPESFVLFGGDNVNNDIYLVLSASGPFVTAGGTVKAELIEYYVHLAGTVVLEETSLLLIPDVNLMQPYDLPTAMLSQPYPNADTRYLGIRWTFIEGSIDGGNYDVNLYVDLTSSSG